MFAVRNSVDKAWHLTKTGSPPTFSSWSKGLEKVASEILGTVLGKAQFEMSALEEISAASRIGMHMSNDKKKKKASL